MKKILLVLATAIKVLTLSSFAGYVVYIFCLDKFLKDDEADDNDNGNDSKSDNGNSDRNSDYGTNSQYGEFNPSDFPPCEDIENPAPDSNISEELLTKCREFFGDMS